MGGRPATDRKVIDQMRTLYDSKTYSVTEITTTGGISRDYDSSKAARELGYRCRPYKDTIMDEVHWLQNQRMQE